MTTILSARSISFSINLTIQNDQIISIEQLSTRMGNGTILFDKYGLKGREVIDLKTGEVVKRLPGEMITIKNNIYVKYYTTALDNALWPSDDFAYIDMNTLIEYTSDVYSRDIQQFRVKYEPNHTIHVVKYYSETRVEHLPKILIKGQIGLFDKITTVNNYIIITLDKFEVIGITPGLTHYLTYIFSGNVHVFKMNIRSITKAAER